MSALETLANLIATTINTTGMTLQGSKAGYRFVKTLRSYAAGGIYNPVFLGNAASSGLSGIAFFSSITGKVLPMTAPVCFAISAGCSCAADTIDGSVSLFSIVL